MKRGQVSCMIINHWYYCCVVTVKEPFEVDTRFQGELTVDDKNVMDVYLSGFSSHDYLLGVMCEFIEYVEHYLKYTIPLQQEWTLVLYIKTVTINDMMM